MKSRQEYMDGKVTHQEYYGQFVTESIKRVVESKIGVDQIKKSHDEHLNDITLKRWDLMAPYINAEAEAKLRVCGDFPSLSSGVCIGKAAARMLIGKD
jgi:hypothetical protein